MSVAAAPLLSIVQSSSARADAVQTLPKGVFFYGLFCHVDWYLVCVLAVAPSIGVTNGSVQVMQSLQESL